MSPIFWVSILLVVAGVGLIAYGLSRKKRAIEVAPITVRAQEAVQADSVSALLDYVMRRSRTNAIEKLSQKDMAFLIEHLIKAHKELAEAQIAQRAVIESMGGRSNSLETRLVVCETTHVREGALVMSVLGVISLFVGVIAGIAEIVVAIGHIAQG